MTEFLDFRWLVQGCAGQRFKCEQKGVHHAVDNRSDTLGFMGAWLDDRLYDEWFYSHSSCCRHSSSVVQDNIRPASSMTQTVSEKVYQ